ncbi:hypothetical protein KFU94_29550 [Chloroflexi bacterium TSY]|nr:hypothetical protein [Chloroflexi bacterium TSY]
MKVKYRILQEIKQDGEWETVGAITYWESEPPHMRLQGSVQHTVSTAIWSIIMQRVKEQKLTLENYHTAFGEYAHNYRLLPEICIVEGESAAAIRKILRNKYVYSSTPETVPIQAQLPESTINCKR